MNCLIVLCALLSICAAAVIPEEAQATIIKYESSSDEAGNYQYSYETSNGIIREEKGYIVNPGKDQYMVVKGSYRYTDENGKPVVVEYTADENGFHPGLVAPNAVNYLSAKALATNKQ